jgi:DNA-damage-inducible protein J
MPTIQFRTDNQTKTASAALFDKLGITMSEALNMFLRQAIMREGIPFSLTIPKSAPDDISSFGLDEAIADAVRRYKYLNNTEPDINAAAPFFSALQVLGVDAKPRITFSVGAVKAQITHNGTMFTIDYNFEEQQSVYILARKDGKLMVKDCALDNIAQTLERF